MRMAISVQERGFPGVRNPIERVNCEIFHKSSEKAIEVVFWWVPLRRMLWVMFTSWRKCCVGHVLDPIDKIKFLAMPLDLSILTAGHIVWPPPIELVIVNAGLFSCSSHAVITRSRA